MEHGNDFLVQASLYFAAAVVAVMASHRLGLGSSFFLLARKPKRPAKES